METLAEVPAIVPAIIILIGNLFSGHPGSRQWEVITALFCYATVISMMLLMIFSLSSIFAASVVGVREVLISTCCFCMLQVLTRDYERIFKPLVSRWIDGLSNCKKGA